MWSSSTPKRTARRSRMTFVVETASRRCAPVSVDLAPLANHLLANLPADDWRRLQPHLKAVKYAVGDVLCDVGRTVNLIIFPTTAIVSMLCLTFDGNCAEVAVVGHDGVVSPTAVTGPSLFRWVVQSAGDAYTLDDLAPRCDRLAGAMRRFTQTLLGQVAQTAVCNRFHSIEQQLCRRLLMGLDRSPDGRLTMTHESAAMLLGVRREGVSVAAQNLRREGLIKYRRGHIDVLDRSRLEDRSCECYADLQVGYHRGLVPGPRSL